MNEEVYKCPKCNRDSMEEVRFATSYSANEGEPGLLCWVCHHGIIGEELDSYFNDYDTEGKENEANNTNNRS